MMLFLLIHLPLSKTRWFGMIRAKGLPMGTVLVILLIVSIEK